MTKRLTYQNKVYSAKELAKIAGIPYATFAGRLKRGLPLEDAMKAGRINAPEKAYCQRCGKELGRYEHKHKYCSRACKDQAQVKRPKHKCKMCGAEISGSNMRTYCSKECHDKAYMKQCKHCGKLYKPKGQEKYCSPECRDKQRLNITYEKTCTECGAVYVANYTFSRFCCNECRRKNDSRVYKARLRNCKVRDKTITLKKVYERDRGICQLCGKHINFSCDKCADEYPTIDHIKPLSKGGNHTWENVQLACRLCNITKGNKDV